MVLSLWAVCLLSAFAVILNYAVRQKLSLIQRVDGKDKLSLAAQAGVEKAILELSKEEKKVYSALKDKWSNNESAFKDVRVDDAVFNVGYALGEGQEPFLFRWGMMDEERKININLAELGVLRRLFQVAANMNEIEAQDIAGCIVDWRDKDGLLSSPSGGAESPYYRSLSYPYGAKDSYFEVLDELLLVKGINGWVFGKIRDYVTIYGEGMVNINTASQAVLLALGLSPGLVEKIFLFRCGKDGLEATADDNIFETASGITALLNQSYPLNSVEKAQLTLISERYLTVVSSFFLIRSQAVSDNRRNQAEVSSVVDKNGKIFYWSQS